MNSRHKTHLFRYRYAGAEWELEIKATDANDARLRLGALAFATYDGVAISEHPVLFAPFDIASVWARNFAVRLFPRLKR